jgi:hypothetical protein
MIHIASSASTSTAAAAAATFCGDSSSSSRPHCEHNRNGRSLSSRKSSSSLTVVLVGMVLVLLLSSSLTVTSAWTTLPLSSSIPSTRENGGTATVGVQQSLLSSLLSPFRLVHCRRRLSMTESSSSSTEASAEEESNANGEQDVGNGEAVDAVPNDNIDISKVVDVDDVTEITASSDEEALEEQKAADEAVASMAAEVVALKDEIAALENNLKAQRRRVLQVSDEADEYTKSGYARQVAAMENMRRARSVRAMVYLTFYIYQNVRDIEKVVALCSPSHTFVFFSLFSYRCSNRPTSTLRRRPY